MDVKLISLLEILKTSWLESITIFAPSNLKLFLLATVNAMKHMYNALLSAWLFMILNLLLIYGISIILVHSTPVILDLHSLHRTLLNFKSYIIHIIVERTILHTLVAYLFAFCFLKAARPSIEKKDVKYWNFEKFFYGLVITLGIFFLITYLYFQCFTGSAHCLVYKLIFYKWFLKIAQLNFFGWFRYFDIFAYFISPLIILIILFLLDSQSRFLERLKAIYRAIIMFFINYPFFFVTYTLFCFSIMLIVELANWMMLNNIAITYLGWLFFIFIALPFYLCFITNFYIKRLHEQFSYYYKADIK